MRSLNEIRTSWRRLNEKGAGDFVLDGTSSDDEDDIDFLRVVFHTIREEEADGLDLDALAYMRGPTPLETGHRPYFLAQNEAYLALLREMVQEFAMHGELVMSLVAAISDIIVRDFVVFRLVLELAKEKNSAAARGVLYTHKFASPIASFATRLALAKTTGDAQDWHVARAAADGLSTHERVRRKFLAKALAYVRLYEASGNKNDLFCARETVTMRETPQTAQRRMADYLIPAEEQAIAFLAIYKITRHVGDLSMAQSAIERVSDIPRRASLIQVLLSF